MSSIVFFKDCIDKVKKVFTLGDDKIANAKKIFLNVFGIISFVGSFFTAKIGVSSYYKPPLIALSAMLLYASYKTISKNKEADKSEMKYESFPRTEKHEEAIDTIMGGISLGKDGISLSTLRKIIALAPKLYKAGDVVHYHESKGEIHGVHALRLLGYIFSNEVTKEQMKVVMEYTGFLKIVKTTYLKRMSEALNQLNEKDQIVPYLSGFVEEIVRDDDKKDKSYKERLVEKLTTIVQKDDKNKWEEFILSLLPKKRDDMKTPKFIAKTGRE